MHAPHVVNPPTSPQGLIDPDEAVRAFLEELGDEVPLCEVEQTAAGDPCENPATWVLIGSCGCQVLYCVPCRAYYLSMTTGPSGIKETCNRHGHGVRSTWRPL